MCLCVCARVCVCASVGAGCSGRLTVLHLARPKEFFCIAMEDLSVDFQTCDQIKGKETHTHTPTCRTRRAVSAYCSLQAQAAPRPR